MQEPTKENTHLRQANPKRSDPMRMNLILTAVLIVIGVAVYWLEFKRNPNKASEFDKNRLISLDQEQPAESVQILDQDKKINIQISCKENCKLNDPNASWQIMSPISFKADEGNVSSLITSVAGVNAQEVLTLEGDVESKLKEFGLAKDTREKRKIVFKMKNDPQPYTVYIGDQSAVGQNLYVLVKGPTPKVKDFPPYDDAHVRIVANYIQTNIDKGLSHWRNKRLFDFAASEVEGLVLHNSSGDTKLSRKDANWFIEPNKTRADHETVDTFITGLVFTNVKDFVSDEKIKDAQKFNLNLKPKYSLEILLAKRSPVKLQIYEKYEGKKNEAQTPKVYATLNDKNFVVELDRTSTDKFGKKPDEFRYKNLLSSAERQSAQKVRVSFAQATLEFTREASSWKLTSGRVEKFDPITVEQGLTKVSASRIAQFEGKKPAPKGTKVSSSWEFIDSNGKPITSFSIYTSTNNTDYYVRLSSGEFAKLDRGPAAAIPSKLEDFQTAPPPTVAPTVATPTVAPKKGN